MSNLASEWLKNYLHIFFFKKIFIGRTVLFTLLLAIVIYCVPPPVYMGNFSVLVLTSDMDTTRILPGTGVFVQPEAVNAGVLSSEQALLMSDRILGVALEKTYERYPDIALGGVSYAMEPISMLSKAIGSFFSLFNSDENKEEKIKLAKIEIFRELITVTPVPGSRTIEVEVVFYDREILEELQNNLLDAYLTTRGEMVVNTTGEEIYTKDSKFYQDQWKNLMDDAADIRGSTNLYDIATQRAEMVSQYLSVNKELDFLNLRMVELENQISLVNASKIPMGLQLNNVKESQLFVQMEETIATMEMEKARLLGIYTEKSTELRSLQLSIDTATNRYKLFLLNSLLMSKQELEDKQKQLILSAKNLESRLLRLDAASNQLLQLDQEIELAQESYQTYIRKLREVQLQSMLRTSSESSIAVVRYPTVGGAAFWPNPFILFPLALFLGLFFGFVGAYMAYYFDDIVLQPSDLNFTNLPVLNSIPEAESTS